MEERKVSEAVIRRMPRYYRHLMFLRAQGVERISSGKLADDMRLNASQVRQDFNCFGEFGQQGYGYNVESLLSEIRAILALTKRYKLIIVGAGNIGQALAQFEGFERDGFEVVALFDVDKSLIGTSVGGKPILDAATMEDYIREQDVDIGVITARRTVAQGIADRMNSAGIRGIWNFAPLDVESVVPVENVHMSDGLICLTYKIDKQ